MIDNNIIMEITDQKVTEYIQGLYKPLNPFLAGLRTEAEARNIPVIRKEIETVLLTLLQINKPGRLLEIGTAVGYSTLCFAMSGNVNHITTLELQEKACREAVRNFERAEQSNKIRLIQGDALESLRKLESESRDQATFDFIFIDGAKGHYLEVWELCIPLCRPGTIIVADNILFRAMTAADEYLDIRRNKTIVNRMRAYLNHITKLSGVTTTVMPVGDGLAISVIEG
ncbi:MAG: O-methyltransferase [Anaerovoracaceae bacterium]